MLNESCPQLGSADAQSLNHSATNDYTPLPSLPSQVACLTPTVFGPLAPMPTTMDELVKLRPDCSRAHLYMLLPLCQKFVDVTGCLDLATLSSQMVEAYAEVALERGLSISTVLNKLNALSSLSRAAFGSADGARLENPFRPAMERLASCIRQEPEESASRLDAVWQLLNDDKFVSFKRSSLLSERATYWMVLLTLFTDMRVTELSYVSPADFAWTSYAGHLIRQRAKDPARVQLHPVHQMLIQCGFLDFIAERWACKAVNLFSDARNPMSLPRTVRRHLLKSWGGSARAVPSWGDFRAARRFAAEILLGRHPDLRSRLADLSRSGTDGADAMDLVLDLEAAMQFDEVNWTLHSDVVAAGTGK